LDEQGGMSQGTVGFFPLGGLLAKSSGFRKFADQAFKAKEFWKSPKRRDRQKKLWTFLDCFADDA
jgi:hypothetical protein